MQQPMSYMVKEERWSCMGQRTHSPYESLQVDIAADGPKDVQSEEDVVLLVEGKKRPHTEEGLSLTVTGDMAEDDVTDTSRPAMGPDEDQAHQSQ
ncbi:hypothetical protein JCGZ_00066 [Jatropha curcas]|uniref:Uncharacterized protein n=1 Tax=Jatropha curcas TaxID=180498 RepID=A0A067JV75_JATCU|nr:hypothetical protein JCGZ_00066 [Jatropha curcas]